MSCELFGTAKADLGSNLANKGFVRFPSLTLYGVCSYHHCILSNPMNVLRKLFTSSYIPTKKRECKIQSDMDI